MLIGGGTHGGNFYKGENGGTYKAEDNITKILIGKSNRCTLSMLKTISHQLVFFPW